MARRNRTYLFQKTGGDFIDPADTGSFIRWKSHVYVSKGNGGKPEDDYVNIDFSMSLGDCSRVISWDFEDYDGDDNELKVEKIDKIIAELKLARSDLIVAERIIAGERARIARDKAKAKKESDKVKTT